MPCGIVDEESGALTITFGSSYKTSDFIVDTIAAKWDALNDQEQADTRLIQIKMDNGPESSGRRTQFLYRMVQLADVINKPIQGVFVQRRKYAVHCILHKGSIGRTPTGICARRSRTHAGSSR